jgi:hypothetical protein
MLVTISGIGLGAIFANPNFIRDDISHPTLDHFNLRGLHVWDRDPGAA